MTIFGPLIRECRRVFVEKSAVSARIADPRPNQDDRYNADATSDEKLPASCVSLFTCEMAKQYPFRKLIFFRGAFRFCGDYIWERLESRLNERKKVHSVLLLWHFLFVKDNAIVWHYSCVMFARAAISITKRITVYARVTSALIIPPRFDDRNNYFFFSYSSRGKCVIFMPPWEWVLNAAFSWITHMSLFEVCAGYWTKSCT